jgi:hypothetical protein
MISLPHICGSYVGFGMESYAGKERRVVNIVTQRWNDVKGSDRDWPERYEIDTADTYGLSHPQIF